MTFGLRIESFFHTGRTKSSSRLMDYKGKKKDSHMKGGYIDDSMVQIDIHL